MRAPEKTHTGIKANSCDIREDALHEQRHAKGEPMVLLREPELRVLVVADDPLARAGLAALLAAQPGATVVGQVAGEAGLSSALDVYRPDIVVWDMG